jgi:hypothetical protein
LWSNFLAGLWSGGLMGLWGGSLLGIHPVEQQLSGLA